MPGYAGDLSPKEAWTLLESDASATLIDVRTRAEWTYVGVPDLSPVNKQTVFIEWQIFPDGSRNPAFDQQVDSLELDKDTPLLFLCRSGARSAAAASLMTQQGFTRCYNVAEGFEGDPDGARHRGSVNGWKVRGLPWMQG
ncbi:MAG: rhodanese-like domain-containing protein [Alphaproteobacteria bacterium]